MRRGHLEDLEGRRRQARPCEQREAQPGQPRLAVGLNLGQLLHRGVQRRRRPQQVEEDPAGIHPKLVRVGVVEREQAVDEVGRQQRDDARDQQIERGAPLAGVDREPDPSREQDDVAHRIADRHQLWQQGQGPIMDVGRDQQDPRDQRQPQGHDQRVDGAGTVRALVASADQCHQPDHQRGVDREVDRVAERRERHIGAKQLRIAVGVDVAEPEQGQPQRKAPPRKSRPGPVDANPGDDAEDPVQAKQVDHRAAALQRRHEQVEQADERAESEVRGPHVAAAERSGYQALPGHGVVVSRPTGAGA